MIIEKSLMSRLERVAETNPIHLRVGFLNSAAAVSASRWEQVEELTTYLAPYFSIEDANLPAEGGRVHALSDSELHRDLMALFLPETGISSAPVWEPWLGNRYWHRREGEIDFFMARPSRVVIVSRPGKDVYVVSPVNEAVACEMRRVIQNNILSRLAERDGAAIFRAAAAAGPPGGVLILGDREASTITALLKLLRDHRFDFVSGNKVFWNLNTSQASGWPGPLCLDRRALEPFSAKYQTWDFDVREGTELLLPQRRILEVLGAKTAPAAVLTRLLWAQSRPDEPTSLEPLAAVEVERALLAACLSPRDLDQPHWLGFVVLDEKACDRFLRDSIAAAARRILAFRLTIGSDFDRYDLGAGLNRLLHRGDQPAQVLSAVRENQAY